MVKPTLAAFAERISFAKLRQREKPTMSIGRAKTELLSGLTVALALVPEAVAFSFVAGVHPLVGLYAAFIVGLITALIGGRPGMISAATGAMALLMVTLVKDHGLQYLLAATVLTGLLQIIAGGLKLGSLMRFVSHSVITGFTRTSTIYSSFITIHYAITTCRHRIWLQIVIVAT